MIFQQSITHKKSPVTNWTSIKTFLLTTAGNKFLYRTNI
tara:strand:- start:220 stop:336 length:117 start_codon:yes stop_codon:yes gene_type:complete